MPKLHINWAEQAINLLVVIVGITIAFALNNWNENRKDQQEERQLLRSLVEDLNQDVRMLDTLIEQLGTYRDQVRILAEHSVFQEENTLRNDPDSLSKLMISLYVYAEFIPVNVTYQSIVSSGKQDLIGNFDLRKKLFSLHTGLYERIRMVDDIHRKEVLDLKMPYLLDKVYIGDVPDQKEFTFMEETKFKNYVLSTYYIMQQKLDLYQEAREQVQSLIVALEKSLE